MLNRSGELDVLEEISDLNKIFEVKCFRGAYLKLWGARSLSMDARDEGLTD